MSPSSSHINSDVQHNRNAYAYLCQLISYIDDAIYESIPILSQVKHSCLVYDANTAYGDLYTSTLYYLEEHLESIYSKSTPEQIKALDDLVFALYHNDNHILDEAEWLLELNKQIRPKHRNMEKLITLKLSDSFSTINKMTPQKAENLFNRFNTLFTPNFKPQLETNIPSIKNRYSTYGLKITEYRFSTQAQRHHGVVRISPLFKNWLRVKAKRVPAEQKITHVYFNNLGIDRERLDIPGSNEKQLSHALHQLENDLQYKLAVITIPSSQGLLKTEAYKDLRPQWSYQEVFDELYAIARFEHHKKGIADFKISRPIRDLLFKNSDHETEVLQHLLQKSFSSFGFHQGDVLSSAQKQAVWLHFNKFELTEYILKTLKPESCNFSCKDAIDRGALSSLYFNLHYSFSSENPLTQEEFTRQIDLSAAYVKGRGMNFHRLILWNAIDYYVHAHYEELLQDNKKSWLIYWRDMNCPKNRVPDLIARRLHHFEELLQKLPSDKATLQSIGFQLLKAMQIHYKNNLQGQRLLLEIISRSNQLLLELPTPESLTTYANLAKELKSQPVFFQFLSGLMKLFVGAFLCSKPLIKEGLFIVNCSFFKSRNDSIKENITAISQLQEQLVAASLNR